MNVIKELEQEQVEKLTADRPIPRFRPGDSLRVSVKVVEGSRERVQAFEGVCIARKNDGLNSSFTVRKISYGEGVERVFPLYSPAIAAIDVVRRGDVRRAKLYYLRGLTGKRARITEKVERRSAMPDETDEGVADAAADRGRKTDRGPPHSPVPARRFAEGQRQGGRGFARARSGLRGRVHRAQERRPELVVHGA